jgi:hypothetical protein
MSDLRIHFRANETFAICGAELGREQMHPHEVNADTARFVNCPKCRDIAIAPPDIEHSAGSFTQ